MVAFGVTLPLVPSTGCQSMLPSLQSCSVVLSTRLFYRPQVQRSHFAVFSVLSSPSQVDQSVKFAEKSKRGNLVPLSQCIFSDHLTPVLAYRCLVNENDHESPSFLFDSVELGFDTATTIGRYSVVGANPAMEIIARENLVTVINHREGWRTEELSEDPLIIPRRITEKWTPQFIDELPQVFCGGWVGYFSYDTIRYTERLSFSSAPEDDRNLPDVHLSLYDDVLVFDHVEKKIHAIHWVQLDQFSSIEEALDDGTNHLDSLLSKVHDIVNPRLSSGSLEPNAQRLNHKLEVSHVTSEAYKMAVSKAKEDMLVDDIHQVVLSQRFVRRTFSDPFEVYRVLSAADPNPFMAYIQVRGCILVASSPQSLIYVDEKSKFTNITLSRTERSDNLKKDAILGKPLINGKACTVEDIRVAEWANKSVKKAPNVYSTCWDALRDALPTEDFTGAPKVEAMELIDKFELKRRGPYGGALGCISFSKDMDITLTSKSIIFPTGKTNDTLYSDESQDNKRREWVVHLQTGATITVDSDPEDKQRQCEREAALLARAIDLAESSFLHRD